jgi:charged multivesicular body protein 6
MGNFSSKGSKSGWAGKKKGGGEITEVDRAILNLKTQRRKLNDQRVRLETLTSRERALVSELLSKKMKGRALLTLKKVKLQEAQLESIDTYLMRVEEQLVGIENTKETKRLFDTLRMGADALKSAQAELSLSEVERLAEDTADAKEYEERLSSLMGESWTGELDGEVAEELEELERAVFGVELPELPAKSLPSTANETTTTTPTAVEEEEEEELPAVPDHEIDPAEVLRQKAKHAGGKLRADPLPA